jgi:hypothetical protein
MKPITIVSGGQTGADRAALDWALAHNVPCGDMDGPVGCDITELSASQARQRSMGADRYRSGLHIAIRCVFLAC